MSIRFSTDSQRAKVLKTLHRNPPTQENLLSGESIDFLFEYIETLESELARSTDTTIAASESGTSLAETDPYYMARAARFRNSID